MNTVSCPNCGHPNADTAKFCAKCGMKLSPAETLAFTPAEPAGGRAPDPTPTPARPAPPPASVPPMSPKEQAAFTPSPTYSPPPAAAYASIPAAYTPPPAGGPAAVVGGPAAGGRHYVAMRTISGLCNVLAWASLVIAILGGLIWIFVAGFDLPSLFIGLFGGIILGGLGWIYWRLLGEAIWLALDIESNTRRAAAALEEQRR
jgi:hypothetical protein